jgi:hypothetical protein
MFYDKMSVRPKINNIARLTFTVPYDEHHKSNFDFNVYSIVNSIIYASSFDNNIDISFRILPNNTIQISNLSKTRLTAESVNLDYMVNNYSIYTVRILEIPG